jgi:hypothetical protein
MTDITELPASPASAPTYNHGFAGSKVNELVRGVNAAAKDNQIIVREASQLTGTIDPAKEYFLDGVIDMTGVGSIEVPAGGINIRGYDFGISKLICSDAAYTMFTSPIGGSGSFLGNDYAIEVTGAGSQVYDLEALTGFEAFEFGRIYYNNCSSLGTVDGYRQGLETGTGRFGGQPSLTLAGTWAGGYRITTSIVRNIDNAMTDPLFKAGAGFTMASRFLTDINVDLGTLAPFTDFSPSNFINPSTLRVTGATMTRNGVANSEDTTIFPNINSTDLPSSWTNNEGISNTFLGGNQAVTVEATTSIAAQSAFYDLAGTWTATDLQHFSAPVNGQLMNDGSAREFRIVGDLVVEGTTGNMVTIKAVRWVDSLSAFVDVGVLTRQINSFQGGRDVAFFSPSFVLTLAENDYVKFQVANDSGTGNVTAEMGSFITVMER